MNDLTVVHISNNEFLGWVEQQLVFSQVTFRVKGNSMYPFLRNGCDLVTLRTFVPEDLKPGTIILFKYQSKYLLHRIIQLKGTNCYLRGDNNWSFCLESCTIDDMVAMVIAVERNGRNISCNSYGWRICSFLWMKSHFLRVMLFNLYRLLKK